MAEEKEIVVEGGSNIPTESAMADINSAIASTPAGASEAYLIDKATELSMIKVGINSQIDRNEAFKESMFELQNAPDHQSVFEVYQRQFSDKLVGGAKRQIQQEIDRDPINNLPLYADTIQSLDTVAEAYSGLEGRQRVLADTYSSESPISRFKRELEVQGLASSIIKEYSESRGVLDKIWDGVGLAFDPMSFTLDAESLVTAIDPNAKGEGGVEKFINTVAGYQSLDPELKREILPQLLDAAIEAYDNNEFKVAAFTALLHDPEFFSETYLTGGLEAAELGGTLAPLTAPFKMAKSIQKLLSFRQMGKAAGNRKEAVESTAHVMETRQVDNAMDADATDWEGTIMGTNQTDGLSGTYQRMVDEIKAEVVQPLSEIRAEDAIVKVDAISPQQKELVMNNALDKLKGDHKGTIESATISKKDSRGFTMQYQITGKEGVQTQEMLWTVDDAGSLIAENQTFQKSLKDVIPNQLLSADAMLRSLDDSIVSDITFGGMQSAVLRRQMADTWKVTDKGLNSKSRQAVDELLIAGDEAVDELGNQGVVFKPGDLLAGNVQTASGKRKYSMEEVKAYYAKRAFFDEAHALQNHIVKRKLEFLGFKEARWTNPVTNMEEVQVARPMPNFQGFTTDAEELIVAPGLKGSGSTVIRRGDLDIASANEQGLVPVRLLNPIKVDGKNVNWGVLPVGGKGEKAMIADLPPQVLNKIPGYVPRISKPGYYYVKDINNGNRTVGRFKTKEEAQAWRDAQHNTQATANTPADELVNLHVLADRDFDALGAITEDADVYGGLYTGSRNRQGIFEGDLLANEMTRLSTGQSVQRMVDAIANVMPMNEYRLAVIEKWKNGVKQALKKFNVPSDKAIWRALDDPQEWKDVPLNIIEDNKLREGLENYREYMIDSLSIPHNSENSWNKYMMKIADMLPNSKVRDLTVSLAHKNPINALKGATFDAYLGWFNPRQLYVQAQNAALAASMYPTKAPGAFGMAMAQRGFLFMNKVDKDLVTKATKGLIQPGEVDDALESLAQFKRSGLRDGVMRTGDYDANLGGFSNGAMEGYRKLASNGRIFFEEGESFARLISWNIARKNWIEANPGKAIDDIAIRSIADDTLRMNMNMQRENAAWWQKNALTAIPTQFLQVQAKFIENVAGSIFGNGRWTPKEAGMALVGQMILYGTAGVPLAKEISGWAKEEASGSELAFNVDNPGWAKAIDQGLWGTFFSVLGFDNNFSDPGSIIAGLDDNIVWDLIGGFADIARGESTEISFSAPSAGVVGRGGSAIITTIDAVRDITTAPTIETAGDSVLKSIDAFASITSTWSNARKIAYLHKLGGIPDKKGNITVSLENLEDTSLQSLVARAMGITLDIENAYYEARAFRADQKKQQADTRKALKQAYLEFSKDGNLEKFKGNSSLILSEYEDQPVVRQEIINTMLENIRDKRSSVDRELEQFLKDYVRSGGKLEMKAYLSTFAKEEETE